MLYPNNHMHSLDKWGVCVRESTMQDLINRGKCDRAIWCIVGMAKDVAPPPQVTVEYRLEGGACIPLRVHTIVISVQHSDQVGLEEIRRALKETIIKVGVAGGGARARGGARGDQEGTQGDYH